MTAVFQNIKNKIVDNKKALMNAILSILLFVIIVINSGYTLTYLNTDTFFKTLIRLISFIVVGFIFVAVVDFKEISTRFKKKKPTWGFIAICIFIFSALLTMFCSGELNNFISYASYIIQIVSAYLIAKLINLKKLISIYQTGLLIICLIALLFYVTRIAFDASLTPLNNFVTDKGKSYENYFFLSFMLTTSSRMQGLFWEPGLFATFLLIGLAFEIVFYKKVRWLYIIVFTISIVFTKSTFGYLLLIVIVLFVINRKVKNFPVACVLYALVLGVTLTFLFFATPIVTWLSQAFPDVFSKMITRNGNVRLIDPDRYQSPIINMQIWFMSPVWGNGMQTADYLYAEIAPDSAQTSTMTFYLSQFGILGIAFTFFFFFGLWKTKCIQNEDKIIFSVLFLVLMNKEPHTGIIFEWILMFLFLKEGCDKDTKALAFETPSENSIIASFTKKDDASILKRNIATSFAIKGLALLFGFFSYPIYRSYFNNDSVLGVWLSVVSIMAMIISLDLGLGNGLKNKMVKALVEEDSEKQKQLISSTYASTIVISLLFLAILTPIIFACDLNSFFNISPDVVRPTILKISSFLVCFSICLEFTLKNVNSLLQAKQKQALSSVFALLSTILLMLFALIFKNGDSNVLLIAIASVYVLTINLPLLVGTFFVFAKEYKGCFPSLKYVTKASFKEVATLGLGFFIIQMLLLLINSTNETFITSIFDSTQVVQYTNYYKPFSIISQLFSIVTLPYWAIIAKEKEENNLTEIKNNIKKLFIFMIVFVVIGIGLSVVFQPFINMWLGENAMEVNYLIVILFNLFVFGWMAASLFSVVLNGLSIVKKQIIFFGIGAVIKVAGCLSILLYKESAQWYFVLIFNIVAYVPIIIGELFIVIHTIRKMSKKQISYEK